MKQKSHSGAKKRVKFTGRKKAMFKKSCKSHLLFNKSKRQKRSFKKGLQADKADEAAIKRLLPYYNH